MILHNRPTLGSNEQVAAAHVISSGWVAQGSEVASFESELCKYFGLPEGHALVVSSGSAALYLALLALDASDARVGVPVYSCAALRNAVQLVGGQCVYLDCAESSPNLDLEKAKLSGIDILIAPSIFGIPIQLPNHQYFRVIEDLAQAFGAKVDGLPIGLRGDLGICSFYATKMITSGGQGGALISRNKDLIDRLRDYRQFDCRHDSKTRFNFQMTDLQAAVGRVQLSRLDSFIETREKWFSLYQLAGLHLLDSKSCSAQPVRYRIVVQCHSPARVIRALSDQGIQAIVPIEESELLDSPLDYPIARELAHSTVSLPAYPSLNEDDVCNIARIVHESV